MPTPMVKVLSRMPQSQVIAGALLAAFGFSFISMTIQRTGGNYHLLDLSLFFDYINSLKNFRRKNSHFIS
jgi:hypothetical protein